MTVQWEYRRVCGGEPHSDDYSIMPIAEWDYQGRAGWELISVKLLANEIGKSFVWGYFKRQLGPNSQEETHKLEMRHVEEFEKKQAEELRHYNEVVKPRLKKQGFYADEDDKETNEEDKNTNWSPHKKTPSPDERT